MEEAENRKNRRLWYLNGDFDLDMAGESAPHLEAAVVEMSLWFMTVGDPQDRILLDCEAPDAYLDHLAGYRIPHPAPALPGEKYPDLTGHPWGWSARARERLVGLGADVRHPDLDVVSKVNARTFCYRVTAELGIGVPGARLLDDAGNLLRGEMDRNGPLVVKPMHGNAGRGLLLLPGGEWSQSQRACLAELADGGEPILVEPWLDRTGDISSRFDLAPDGAISHLQHHRTLSGSRGAFFGVILEPSGGSLQGWADRLDAAAEGVGRALHRTGYFGPVGIDSFEWRDRAGDPQLALAVDINARLPMSTIAYALQRKTRPDHHLLLRTMSAKKHRLPDDYRSWLSTLDELAYDPRTGTGVFLATPLFVFRHGKRQQPKRSLFCLLAPDKARLQDLYSRFIQRTSRSRHHSLP